MALYGALSSAVSGLRAQSQSIAVISDNIANVNTIGYKAAKQRFTTLVTAPPSPRSYNPGGVLANFTQQVDLQGLLQASTNATDLAITGRGFFVTAEALNTNGSVPVGSERLFTRAGSFQTDLNGRLVNAAGRYLLGVAIPTGLFADPNNVNLDQLPLPDVSQLTAINVARITANASRTREISVGLNMSAVASDPRQVSAGPPPVLAALAGNTPLSTLDTQAPGSAFRFSTTIYDSLGVAHTMTFVLTRDVDNATPATAAPARQYRVGIASSTYVNQSGATVSSGTIAGATIPTIPGNQTVGQLTAASNFHLGTIQFNTDGSISSFRHRNVTGGDAALREQTIRFTTGARSTGFRLDFNGGAAVPTNEGQGVTTQATTRLLLGTRNTNDGFTNFDSASVVTSINQNGVPFGFRTGVAIDDRGVVRAIFDNGARVPVAVIPLVTFTDVNNLEPRSGNVYAETQLSGGRTLNYAARGGAGLIKSNSLETSTTDLGDEFSNLIVTQRSYQANTRTITTTDNLLQEIINIVR